MEIERKYLIDKLPDKLDSFAYHIIEQGYLCTNPVVRVRRQDDEYYLTYKSAGMMAREEYNLPLTKEAYEHLLKKTDGNIITKKRYLIPLGDHLKVELDIFSDLFDGLVLAEVEFPTQEEANSFIPPSWLVKDVTFSQEYHNSTLSKKKF